MGAYSPAPVFDETVEQRVMKEIVVPTIEAMKQEGAPYQGVLYVGLMMTQECDQPFAMTRARAQMDIRQKQRSPALPFSGPQCVVGPESHEPKLPIGCLSKMTMAGSIVLAGARLR
jgi:hypothetical protein